MTNKYSNASPNILQYRRPIALSGLEIRMCLLAEENKKNRPGIPIKYFQTIVTYKQEGWD
jgi:hypothetical protein